MFCLQIPMTIVVHLGYSTWINSVRIFAPKLCDIFKHLEILKYSHELDLFFNWFDFPLWHKGNVLERRFIPF